MAERVPNDELSASLTSNRQRVILQLFEAGQIDAEEASAMYVETESVAHTNADRQAAETGQFGPDTPSGHLALLRGKLRPRDNP